VNWNDRSLSPKEKEFRRSLLEWGRSNVREYPWRERNRSLYEVFIAEFFLTQTPADNVSAVYPSFLRRFPSLKVINEASEDELIEVIRPLGFYNMRASALKEIADIVDSIPEDPDELVELPRVGRYVANATVCFALGRPLPILDRNVERIYQRVFAGRWPSSEEEQLEYTSALVPTDESRLYNFSLLDFGAAVCQSTPDCENCFATGYCEYYRNSVE